MKNGCTLFFSIVVLVVAQLACGQPAEEWQLRGWTQTPALAEPTQTERIVVWTSTPVYTYTPIVKIVTETPKPEYLCVTADEAVHLRPSPSTDNYPIEPLEKGSRLLDLGGRNGNWIFVGYKDKSGWVNQKYLEECK